MKPTITPLSPGLERGDDGHAIGRDPRKLTADDLRALGHQPMSAQDALRARCLDCCAGSPAEVRSCTAIKCPAWPFRMGKNPWRPALSEGERQARRDRLAKMKAGRSGAVKSQGSDATSPSPAGVAREGEARS